MPSQAFIEDDFLQFVVCHQEEWRRQERTRELRASEGWGREDGRGKNSISRTIYFFLLIYSSLISKLIGTRCPGRVNGRGKAREFGFFFLLT
jgi:hypothetical protein